MVNTRVTRYAWLLYISRLKMATRGIVGKRPLSPWGRRAGERWTRDWQISRTELPHPALSAFPLCYTSPLLNSLVYNSLAVDGIQEGQREWGRKVTLVPPILLQGTMVITARQPAKMSVPELQKVTSKETCPRTRSNKSRGEQKCCKRHVGGRKRYEAAFLLSKTKTLKESHILRV